MQFNALSVAKFVVSGVVGLGAGKIVGQIVKNNIAPETLIEKVAMTAAVWAIGGMATKATKKYTDEQIDEAAEIVTGIVVDIKTRRKLVRINSGESTFEKEGLEEADFEKKDDKWVIPKKDVPTNETASS